MAGYSHDGVCLRLRQADVAKDLDMASRKKDPLYEKRNKDIAHRCLVLGESDSTIAQAWGMEEHTVRALRRRQGIKSSSDDAKDQQVNKRAHANMKPLSPLHQQIGVKLDSFRNFVVRETPTQFAFRMRITRMRLRKMELGAWDFTLSDLQKIAEVTKTPLLDLLKQHNAIHAKVS